MSSEPLKEKAQENVCKRWWTQRSKVGWKQEEYAGIMKKIMTGKLFPSCLKVNVVEWSQVFGSTGKKSPDLVAFKPWIPGAYIYHLTFLLQAHFLLASFQSTLQPPYFLVMLYHAHLLYLLHLSCKIFGVRRSCSDQCNAGKWVTVHNFRLLGDATL